MQTGDEWCYARAMRRGLALAGILWASTADADSNDLIMSRLATRMTDASGNVTGIVPQNLDLRALSSQLGVVLAPHLLTPADTIGFGGFQLTVDYATTTVAGKHRATSGAMLGPACFAPLVTLAKNKIGWYDSVLNFRGDVGQPGRRALRIGFEYNRSFCSSSIFYKSIGADSSILIAGLPSFPISPTSFPEVVY